MKNPAQSRQIIYLGSSRKDSERLPEDVGDVFSEALQMAVRGETRKQLPPLGGSCLQKKESNGPNRSTRRIMAKTKKKAKVESEKIEYEFGSGNVFRDFGFPNPEEAKAKSDLAILIEEFIKQNDLTQEEAAILMGIDQPKISKITKGILSGFSVEWLMNCLILLGFDIEIKPVMKQSLHPSIHVTQPARRRPRAHV